MPISETGTMSSLRPIQLSLNDYICVQSLSHHPQRNTSGSSRFAVSNSPARVAGCIGVIG